MKTTSYSFTFPSVCLTAIAPLLPQGWTEKDGERKLLNTMSSAFAAIEFGEKTSKSVKRLKFQAKKQLAGYSTSMEGSTKSVSQRPIDLYNWLWDIAELESKWSNKDFPALVEVNVPPQLADWITTVFAAKAAKPEVESAEETEDAEVNA